MPSRRVNSVTNGMVGAGEVARRRSEQYSTAESCLTDKKEEGEVKGEEGRLGLRLKLGQRMRSGGGGGSCDGRSDVGATLPR